MTDKERYEAGQKMLREAALKKRYEEDIRNREKSKMRFYEIPQDYSAPTSSKSIKKKKVNKKRLKITSGITIGILLAISVAVIILIILSLREDDETEEVIETEATNVKIVAERPELDVQLLTINDYSRPGTALEEVKGIVVHYTANPGTTAQQNHDYFEGLKTTHVARVSSHFIIGLNGEIIQCIPTSEIAYASNERNVDTISIECCHADETGAFNQDTYDSLVYLTAWLMGKFDLSIDDIIRHYDVTGKECPKYYVENEDAWLRFKEDVRNYIEENGIDKVGFETTK